MADFDSNHLDKALSGDEVDPLLPIPEETNQEVPISQPNTLNVSHTHSPTHKRHRRPSFGTNFLSRSPSGHPDSDNTGRYAPIGTFAHQEPAYDPVEVDAMGMLHNDLSGTSLNSMGAGSSFIDHTKYIQLTSPRKTNPQQTVRRKSSTSSQAGRTKYIPPGVQPTPTPPSQITRPSFAEQWVKRQNSTDANTGAGSSKNRNPFAPEESSVGYGSISWSQEDKNRRKNSAERRYHQLTPHHSNFEPMREAPFTDDYTDTIPHGLHRRSSSSASNEFEFSGSNPSSRRSSESSSLDDVCFPLVDIGQTGPKSWPDTLVLEEFAEEEKKELEELSKLTAAQFEAQQQEGKNLSSTMTRQSSFSTNLAVNFQTPLVTSIDANVPISKFRNNETEPINGRLRPPKVVPWDPKSRLQATAPLFLQSGGNIPVIQHNNYDYTKSLIEQFRFTYFREELESTIHSPNISGLIRDGQTFDDLFTASHYANASSTSLNNSALMEVNSGKGNNNSSAQISRTPTATKTPTPSIKGIEQADVSPFWLDVLNPTEEEMKVLSKAFGIHPLTTEDIFLGETREKVELFRDYYLVCFRSFDIVHERYRQKKEWERKAKELEEDLEESHGGGHESTIKNLLSSIWKSRKTGTSNRDTNSSISAPSLTSSQKLKQRKQRLKENKQKGGYRHKPREGELAPLNMYIIVFREGVITFHFAPTPHPVNVRRRARLLRDYLTVSADWIGYALIDDITDAFAPMIESIEDEVNAIEDAILRMNSYDSDDSDSDSDDSDSDSDDSDDDRPFWKKPNGATSSGANFTDSKSILSKRSKRSNKSSSSRSSSTRSISSSQSSVSHIAGWKKKGDMLRRIGECRKKVMSILRLLGSKADVIKGFAKRCNEQWEVAPRSEIGMYLGDIQDHIVTMVQSLNHYEKLLARSHSNYLAQINIDMTRVNNDMNDVLGKITILGTVVLPMNIITGLWGMNVIVPGQDVNSLNWFFGILIGMSLLAFLCFMYARRAAGLIT